VIVRLLTDEPAGGAWNMAVDEALLESAAQGGTATLRIYRWSEPTLSLGYFQAYSERESHPASLSCAVVRRPSGGGAILHHRELTYCFTVPLLDRWATSVKELYQALHGALVQALNALEVPAELWKLAPNSENRAEPFLCFERRSEGDVVAKGFKIAGSAQRRRRNAVLQHGSILLEKSGFAAELLGIQNLTSNPPAPDRLRARWLETLQKHLGLTLQAGELTAEETDLARILAEEKYGSAPWIFRK
jgi:lipoate-protein ligase A